MIVFSFSDTTPSKFKFSGETSKKETIEGKLKIKPINDDT